MLLKTEIRVQVLEGEEETDVKAWTNAATPQARKNIVMVSTLTYKKDREKTVSISQANAALEPKTGKEAASPPRRGQ